MAVGLTVNTPLGSLRVRVTSPVRAAPYTLKVFSALVVIITSPQSISVDETEIVGLVAEPFMYQKLAVPSWLMTISVTGLPR